jgi:hypothetical protein
LRSETVTIGHLGSHDANLWPSENCWIRNQPDKPTLTGMISKQWRGRLIYTAMSSLVAWHTIAIVVVPAPHSSAALLRLLHPYLTLFRLGNKWSFYASNVGYGQQFRYVVEDAAGRQHTFMPTESFGWFHPRYWWFTAWYNTIMRSPDEQADLAAALLCKMHVSLKPVSIILIKVLQNGFSAKDHLDGKHPMDAEFVTEKILRRVKCPGK